MELEVIGEIYLRLFRFKPFDLPNSIKNVYISL